MEKTRQYFEEKIKNIKKRVELYVEQAMQLYKAFSSAPDESKEISKTIEIKEFLEKIVGEITVTPPSGESTRAIGKADLAAGVGLVASSGLTTGAGMTTGSGLAASIAVATGVGALLVGGAAVTAGGIIYFKRKADWKHYIKLKIEAMINKEIKEELQNCSTGLQELYSAIFSPQSSLNNENFLKRKIFPELDASNIKNTVEFLRFIHRIQNNSLINDYTQGLWNEKFGEYETYLWEKIDHVKKKLLMIHLKEKLPHISETFIEALLKNYQEYGEEPREDYHILTGFPLSQKKVKKFIRYLEFSTNIYTDTQTRSFVAQHRNTSIMEKWIKIINHKTKIDELSENLSAIIKERNQIIRASTQHEQTGSVLLPSKPGLSLSAEKRFEHLRKPYKICLQAINNFLQTTLQRSPIQDPELQLMDNVEEQLNGIRQEIENKFYWHFNAKNCDSGQLFSYKGNSYKLSSQAVVAASFLDKSKLSSDNNITILDVGFRNLEELKKNLEKILSVPLRFKSNPTSHFDNLGEVDFIAYIEPTFKGDEHVDRLVIIYSGSNSLKDWVKDLNLGWTPFQDLSVHEGIGALFNESIKTYHTLLMNRIRDYYQNHEKPNRFKIITAGHSLGGANALLAAYYYKTRQQRQDLKDILKIKKKNILVKTVTFGAPAILAKTAKELLETVLAKENIFRVWNHGDKVVSLSERCSYHHAGRSFPFYNIPNHPFNRSDAWWAPHGLGRYQNYLLALQNMNSSPNHKQLAEILRDYINPEI